MKKKKKKVFMFTNFKGGVGKTTLCVSFAHYLVSRGQMVTVFDVDYNQQSLSEKREDELSKYEDDNMEVPFEVHKFTNLRNATAVATLTNNILNEIEGNVLIDAPGTAIEKGYAQLLINSDYVVCPYNYSEDTIKQTNKLIQSLIDIHKLNKQIKTQLILVPNDIHSSEGTREELEAISQLEAAWSSVPYFMVAPKIPHRAGVKKTWSTLEMGDAHAKATKRSFDFIYKNIFTE